VQESDTKEQILTADEWHTRQDVWENSVTRCCVMSVNKLKMNA